MFVPFQFVLNVHDPFKLPDCRFRRVHYLIEHGRQPLPDLDDEITRQAWGYFQELQGCAPAEQERIAQRYPALAEAHRFSEAEPLQRWELEARLLGGDTDEVIAARCGLSPAGVAAFHDLFFNVRPYLNAFAYILGVVLGGGAVFDTLEAGDHERLLKLFGYNLGGHGVDALLDYLREPPTVPDRLDALDLAALRKLRARLRIQVLVLLLTTPVADLEPAHWLEINRRLVAARSRDEAATLGDIQAALDAIALMSRKTPRSDTAGTAVPA